jgi:hypothetical protein
MLAAKGTDNRQIADGNIALLLSPLSEDALNPFQGAADSGRGNPEETSRAARRRAQIELVRERVFTLRPGSKKL